MLSASRDISANGSAITSFTQAQLSSGSVYFVADSLNADNTPYAGQGSFTVSLSDGAASRPATTATVGVSIGQVSTSEGLTASPQGAGRTGAMRRAASLRARRCVDARTP